MTKFNELPLETQFLIERCSRSYRRLCILNCRKPTIEELTDETHLTENELSIVFKYFIKYKVLKDFKIEYNKNDYLEYQNS
jgi:hypothetical protein